MTWWIIGLKTTPSGSPPPPFHFLQVKIGILIAQPQFLIHDAQKGHGSLISSDYEHPELGPGCFLIGFNSSLPEITVCKHMEV